jgi:hypothetical protein
MIKFLDMRTESRPMLEVVDQYDSFFALGLTDQQKGELIQHLLEPSSPCSDGIHEPPLAENSIHSGGSS